MGFGSKKKIIVFTSAMHLADASNDPLREAIITAVLDNKGIPEELTKTLIKGLGIMMIRAYKYARDHYTLGLPEGFSSVVATVEDSVLQPIIATDIGHPDGVLVDYSTIITSDISMAVQPYLTSKYGFNNETNELTTNIPPELLLKDPLSNPSGTIDCSILSDTDADASPYCYGNAPFRYVVSDGDFTNVGQTDQVTLTYEAQVLVTTMTTNPYTGKPQFVNEWQTATNSKTGNPRVVTEIVNVDPDFEFDIDYYYVAYYKLDTNGFVIPTKKYWLYNLESGLYPQLEPDTDVYSEDTFLPVVPVRYFNQDYTDPSRIGTPLYDTSEEYLSKLKMDFRGLGNKVNENPDVGDIDHAYVMFGVDFQTEHSSSLWYAGLFFDQLADLQKINRDDYINSSVIPGESPPLNTYGTNNAAYQSSATLTENGLDLRVSWQYITSDIRVGRVAKINRAVKVFSGSTLIIKMQISKYNYRQVTVYGLEIFNRIYKNKGIRTTVDKIANDEDDHNLILPIQYNLAASMSLRFRNELYVDGSMMIINGYEKVKVKWYQRGFFKIVMVIIAIVITAFTGQAWLISLAGTIGTLATAVVAVVVGYVVNMAVGFVLDIIADLLVKVFGASIALILSVVLFVVGVALGYTNVDFLMVTANMMTQLSTALISSVNEFLIEERQDIIDDYAAFSEKLADKYEELQTAIDLMKNNYDIDPLRFTRPARFVMVPSEGPDQFYQRCLGLPDNSVYVIHDQISNFVETKQVLNKNIDKELYNQNIRI